MGVVAGTRGRGRPTTSAMSARSMPSTRTDAGSHRRSVAIRGVISSSGSSSTNASVSGYSPRHRTSQLLQQRQRAADVRTQSALASRTASSLCRDAAKLESHCNYDNQSGGTKNNKNKNSAIATRTATRTTTATTTATATTPKVRTGKAGRTTNTTESVSFAGQPHTIHSKCGCQGCVSGLQLMADICQHAKTLPMDPLLLATIQSRINTTHSPLYGLANLVQDVTQLLMPLTGSSPLHATRRSSTPVALAKQLRQSLEQVCTQLHSPQTPSTSLFSAIATIPTPQSEEQRTPSPSPPLLLLTPSSSSSLSLCNKQRSFSSLDPAAVLNALGSGVPPSPSIIPTATIIPTETTLSPLSSSRKPFYSTIPTTTPTTIPTTIPTLTTIPTTASRCSLSSSTDYNIVSHSKLSLLPDNMVAIIKQSHHTLCDDIATDPESTLPSPKSLDAVEAVLSHNPLSLPLFKRSNNSTAISPSVLGTVATTATTGTSVASTSTVVAEPPTPPTDSVDLHSPPTWDSLEHATVSLGEQDDHSNQHDRPTSISKDPKRSSTSKLTSSADTSSGNRKCNYCGATSTPMWRHGPGVYKNLCNSCGVKWRRGKILQSKQLRHPLCGPPKPQRRSTTPLVAVSATPSISLSALSSEASMDTDTTPSPTTRRAVALSETESNDAVVVDALSEPLLVDHVLTTTTTTSPPSELDLDPPTCWNSNTPRHMSLPNIMSRSVSAAPPSTLASGGGITRHNRRRRSSSGPGLNHSNSRDPSTIPTVPITGSTTGTTTGSTTVPTTVPTTGSTLLKHTSTTVASLQPLVTSSLLSADHVCCPPAILMDSVVSFVIGEEEKEKKKMLTAAVGIAEHDDNAMVVMDCINHNDVLMSCQTPLKEPTPDSLISMQTTITTTTLQSSLPTIAESPSPSPQTPLSTTAAAAASAAVLHQTLDSSAFPFTPASSMDMCLDTKDISLLQDSTRTAGTAASILVDPMLVDEPDSFLTETTPQVSFASPESLVELQPRVAADEQKNSMLAQQQQLLLSDPQSTVIKPVSPPLTLLPETALVPPLSSHPSAHSSSQPKPAPIRIRLPKIHLNSGANSSSNNKPSNVGSVDTLASDRSTSKHDTPNNYSFASPSARSLRTHEFATLLKMVPKEKIEGFADILASGLDDSHKEAMVRGEQVNVSVMLLRQPTWQSLWDYARACC
ncbi:hypothetical protein BASA50_008191 [Batrachochytrium salamandrivorans]|uniref:GATA-type domain-containing protein n=1 Tax=Batrachochytrium salamandrivorans TaxID=1357716 RepID=A0ABQ8F818_9FUNG|nr:hypothetical protein BASA50_008191 [Batrachochytrium salamandrivorans]